MTGHFYHSNCLVLIETSLFSATPAPNSIRVIREINVSGGATTGHHPAPLRAGAAPLHILATPLSVVMAHTARPPERDAGASELAFAVLRLGDF